MTAIKILWRNGEPKFIFRGHNMDGSNIFEQYERKKFITELHCKRDFFHHHSVGLKKFQNDLKEAIEQGKDVDYAYDGEDEYPVYIFCSENATRAVMRLLKDKKLIKYLL